MKTRLIAFFSVALALGTMAAYNGPRFATPGATYPGGNNNLRAAYGAGSNAWGQGRRNYFTGWEFDQGAINEIYGGSMAFSRGSTTGATQLYIYGNVSGYFGGVVHNSSALSGTSTTIIIDPNVTITSSKRAVMLRDNHPNNNSVGTWRIVGGDFVAANEAVLAQNVSSITLDSASFQAGGSGHSAVYVAGGAVIIQNSRERTGLVYEASNASSTVGSGVYAGSSLSISGGNTSFIASQGPSSDISESIIDNISGQSANSSGVGGAVSGGAGTLNGGNYHFIGSESGSATVGGNNATALAYGGHGAAFSSGNGTVSNSSFRATSGGEAEIVPVTYLIGPENRVMTANNATAVAHGGSGLYTGTGTRTLIDSTGLGGSGGSASANYTGGYADASGGNGVYTRGSLTVTGGRYEGQSGGNASAAEGEAYALGGNGIFSGGTGTLNINGGTFIGSNGGTVNDSGLGAADGGAGIRTSGGTVNIFGGTFTGGRGGKVNGIQQMGDIGLWAQNTTLNISDSFAETKINGDIYFNNSGAEDLSITGGTIEGDIHKTGAGKATVSVNNAARYSGAFYQKMGDVDVNLSNSDESKFFSNVTIEDGTMEFKNHDVITAENSRFTLTGSGSILSTDGVLDLELTSGSRVSAGYGKLQVGGDLNLGEGSSAGFSFNGLTGEEGAIAIGGALIASNANSRIIADGTSAVPSGNFAIAIPGGVVRGARALEDVIDIDLGWLTKVTSLTEVSGIEVMYDYNSLTNTSLSNIDSGLLLDVDAYILGSTSNKFFNLNAKSESEGESLFRYTLSQIPDATEATFDVNLQVKEQIAGRNSEYRSMNGYASSKQGLYKQNQPVGVAGPEEEDENDVQGWVRAYGAFGDKDKTSSFTSYDSAAWGTVIGIDKSFENILVGIAGGFARSDLDAGSTYDAKIETYHGSIYSTIGGDSIYVDLAATYGMSDTEADNETVKDEFDSMFMSLYAAIGKTFAAGDKVAITPEASLLFTYYEQEEYSRVGLLAGTMIEEYDTESTLSSLGVNIATVHQIDWFNRGMAVIPEVRAHWLHEFNADPDDFTYSTGGSSYTFGVRPRDEDLFRLGAGLDFWSWKFQRTKFEIDYDGLFSDTYREHVLSGKLTVKF